MNIKYLVICLIMQMSHYTTLVYSPSTGAYKEVSMLANEALKKLVYAHYENPKAAANVAAKRNPKGQKFQEGGEINYDRGRQNIANRREAAKAATQQELQIQAEQLKVNILTYGTIGLVSLFFVIATTTFCILYTRRNKNKSHTSNY